MSINKVIICGNVSSDPELRSTANGTLLLTFDIVSNDRVKGQNGEYEDYPNFIGCNLFGTRAEKLSKIVHKGMKVTVEGRLHHNRWEDKQTGKKKSNHTVTVDDIELPPKFKQTAEGSISTSQTSVYDRDIPF